MFFVTGPSKTMSCFALLKKGNNEFMIVESIDPSGLAASLAFQYNVWVQVSASFPNKALSPDTLGVPMKQWVKGDELQLIKALVGALSLPPPFWTGCDSDPVDIWSVLQPCSKEESDTAAVCKQAVYEKYDKKIARPILKEECVEKTTTISGYYKKVLQNMQGQCLRVKR